MTESKSNTPYFTPYDEEGSFNIELDDTINPTYQNSSVTDFAQDKQVIRSFEKVTDYLSANRGVGSALLDQATIGKQTDIAEFMRDDVSRLGAPLAKAAILKDAPEDVKAAYRLMQDRFNASSLTGIGEHVDAFIDYILTRYHQTHRDELAELILLARKVEAVHGDHPDVPVGLSDALFEMAEQLDAHMAKEEMVLFPAMRKMCEDGSIAVQLVMPIHCMREEHDDHGEAIHRLQKLTNHFTLPDGVCGSWRALYSGTAKLVEDLVAHIHLENEVLFPRFE